MLHVYEFISELLNAYLTFLFVDSRLYRRARLAVVKKLEKIRVARLAINVFNQNYKHISKWNNYRQTRNMLTWYLQKKVFFYSPKMVTKAYLPNTAL